MMLMRTDSTRSSSSTGSSSMGSDARIPHSSNNGHNKFATVASSVSVYWFFVSLIPIYNKFFFRKDLYPFPIATAGIQLAVVAGLLGFWNMAQHYVSIRKHTNQNNDVFKEQQQQEESPEGATASSLSSSWILGPHLWFKLQWCFPIGVLFGLKYGITNWGLHLVPAPTHLLLQSTDLVWTVLGAWWINQERVRQPLEMACLVGCVVGSFVLSWNHIKDAEQNGASESMTHHHLQQLESPISLFEQPWFAIGINLLSPMLLGLCISTLRLACTELMRPDNCLQGQVTSVELTCLKLIMSSGVATALAMVMEPTWCTAFWNLDGSTQGGVLGGALLIACFQVNCTFLTFLTNAVSVGLVGQVKIIPQWIVATLFATYVTQDFHLASPNLLGALLILVSAAAYCYSNYQNSNNNNEDPSENDAETQSDNRPAGTGSSHRGSYNDDAEVGLVTAPLLLIRKDSAVNSGYLSIT